MPLFDRFAPLIQTYGAIRSAGADPFNVRVERVLSASTAVINGRHTIMAGTNNYLGLTLDEACVSAAVRAIESEGTGTTGSRIANGSYAGHAALERQVAAFLGRRHGMVFTTGYQANLGILSTIVGPKDHLIIDSDSHASIYDASRLGAATVIRFKHNDPADLDRRLQRLAGEPGNKVVVVEGIYSMLGDQAPLAEIAAVKRRHADTYLVVDEAHSLGVLGAHSRGLAEAAGVEDEVDFVVGTFSKSLGAIGGFCASDHPDFDILRVTCRPYMFTASLPPSIIASTRAALSVLADRPELRTRLWSNVDVLYNGLARRGFRLGPQKGPIVAVHMPSPDIAIRAWQTLLDSGVYVNLALPPATPNGVALLRCSVCAAHEPGQMLQIVETLTSIACELGLMEPLRSAAMA